MKRIILIGGLFLLMVGVAWGGPIGPQLAKKMEVTGQNGKLPVLVEYQTPFSVKALLQTYRIRGDRQARTAQLMSLLQKEAQVEHNLLAEICQGAKGEVTHFKSFWLTNMVALKASVRLLRKIATLPGIKRIILDEEKSFLPPDKPSRNKGTAWGIHYTGADQFGPNAGAGIVVAVIDTGVDYRHPIFAGRVDTDNDYDFYNNDDDAWDDHYHGTHCAGTVAGGNDASGQRIGVAPGATILPIKVLSASGSGSWESVASGIQHAFAKNVQVASMSLGGGYTIAPDSALYQAIINCIDNDIVMVIAAGNSGYYGKETINAPGCMREVITVGAIKSNGSIASFSSKGPTKETGFVKPDLTAPGVDIYSAAPNNSYKTLDGTSMATPHVAGAAAVILANNSFTPGTVHYAVKARLMENVKPGSHAQDNVYGKGCLWLPGAVNARNAETITVTIKPLGQVHQVTQPCLSSAPSSQNRDIDIDNIINYAKQFWQFIADNQPVVNTSYDYANAIPSGATGWADLANWKGPSSRDYVLTAKNLYGMKVVEFQYRVMWTWGGDCQGQGQYLTNVTAVPVNVWVAWGYTFESNVEVPQVYNVGSSSNPVAAMQMVVKWKVHTIVTHAEGAGTYEVRGTGEFREIGNK